MAERVTGPYKGFFISAQAILVRRAGSPTNEADYVGSVNIARDTPDNAYQYEKVFELSETASVGSEEAALEKVEQAAREYIDGLWSLQP
jgi:hypothetical protein